MACVRIMMVPRHKLEAILNAKSMTRPLSAIVTDISTIIVKGDNAVNLDNAQKLEELGIELIRIAGDTHSACF